MSDPTADLDRRFGGIARLYGDAALARFRRARVCVVGVGGVGSWVVEGLARSGIGHLTLIDLDNVCESNVNRQLPALDPLFGMAKVTALAERVRAINPSCAVEEIEDFVTEDNLDAMLGRDFDFIVDAIDSQRVKTAMTVWCVKRRQPFMVSGGAGGQMDPTRIRVADLGEVTDDPLLAKMRYTLRRHHGFPREQGKRMRVPCVYSTEPLTWPQSGHCETESGPRGLSCAGFGASMAVTASFGMVMVSRVLAHLAAAAAKGA
ncbi:tRNA threonylcarbamoyladenosine dehydratase [Paludibacterium paludis]|uniref:tRNA threonylcarbamoyladenosine dehydratase n=1 Tax=Paludibacterium paludis TaxID=1225769 RepID=A0A918P107_9NEIS|nr:tRNA threonylcarbamoyladenosine dehydratase [Paludibacterium paludis]GGY09460.1 tRNA threonylcarbamoyladenosine dehydratase [Paludibacterium paludis]